MVKFKIVMFTIVMEILILSGISNALPTHIHSFISYEASKINGVSEEIRNPQYMGDHEDPISDDSDSTICEGAYDEDWNREPLSNPDNWNEDESYIGWGTHFWDPLEGPEDGHLVYVDVPYVHLPYNVNREDKDENGVIVRRNAYQRASNLYTDAVKLYREGNRATAYYVLGKVSHLLEDMSTPSHVHLDSHICKSIVCDDPDSYEEYLEANCTTFESFQGLVGNPDAYRDTYEDAETLPGDGSPLYKLFYSMAMNAKQYDSDDHVGTVDQGRSYLWSADISRDDVYRVILVPGTGTEQVIMAYQVSVGMLHISHELFTSIASSGGWLRIEYQAPISSENFYPSNFTKTIPSHEMKRLAEILFPKVVQHVAGLYVLFYHDTHRSDLSGDGKVNLVDFAELSRNWFLINCTRQNNWCDGADINHSGSVDEEDLLLMSEVCLDGVKISADMVVIPAGTFQMGNSKGASEGFIDELPVHTVLLDSFGMSKYEITNAQYCAFLKSAYPSQLKVVNGIVYGSTDTAKSYPYCDTSPSSSYSQIVFSNDSFSVRTKSGRDMTNYPMATVSWYGAVAFCNWRSQQEGKQTCYNLSTWACDFSKKGYRLATEAEWEYAARGGRTGSRYPWGDTISQTQANYLSSQYHPLWNDGTYPYTSPVGFFDGTNKYKSQYNWPGSATSYQTTNGANGYGLYDISGNVWEWCHDWYGSYSSGSQTKPTGPATGSTRVMRCGAWDDVDHGCRVSDRSYHPPSGRHYSIGFRVVLDF